jgi:Uma2 family endonuclease
MSAVLVPKEPAVALPPADPRPWKWTREQYHRLGEQGFFHGKRVELIRGEVIEMSPMKEPHACGIALTSESLRTAFGDGFYVRTQVPLSLGCSEPEPDVAVVVGSPRDYTSPPTTALLIVEIADSTLFYDTTTKAELYAEAGVADYWVLDVANRRLLVFRDPEPLSAGGTAYRTHLTLFETDRVSPLAAPTVTIAVKDLLP